MHSAASPTMAVSTLSLIPELLQGFSNPDNNFSCKTGLTDNVKGVLLLMLPVVMFMVEQLFLF